MIGKQTEDKIIELCKEGLCVAHIAKQLGISKGPVKRVLEENRLTAVNGNKTEVDEKTAQDIAEMYKSGIRILDIEAKYNIPESVVYRIVDEHGLGRKRKKGTDLTDKILELYSQGYGTYQIADRLGCSRTLVVKVADENGIERRSTHISNETKDKIEELYTQGKGIRIITRELNTTRHTVVRCLRDRGYDTARNSTGKLTIEKVMERLGDQWEYVSGYERYNSKIVVRCRHCGTEKEVSRQSALYEGGLGECRCFKQERRIEAETEKILGFWQELQKPRPLFKDFVVASCRNCGKPFVKEGQSRFCSDKCRKSSSKAQRYRHDDRRLRRKNASECDNITLDALINRDGLNCWICGEPCDLEDSFWIDKTFYAGNRYPSIDHVIPLAKGGTHTWDNVRVAHRICNSIKGDSVSND